MSKSQIILIWGAILLSIVIAVVSLHVSLCDKYNPDFDANTFLVSILTLLVTILLGWNIYSVIDAKDRIINIERNNDNFRSQAEEEIEEIKSDTSTLHELIAEVRSAVSYQQGIANSLNDEFSLHLLTYSCFQNALYYSLDAGTGMLPENTDKFLKLMETIADGLNSIDLSEYNEDTIAMINNRTEAISKHGNPAFTVDQRERFSIVSRKIREIVKASNTTNQRTI